MHQIREVTYRFLQALDRMKGGLILQLQLQMALVAVGSGGILSTMNHKKMASEHAERGGIGLSHV